MMERIDPGTLAFPFLIALSIPTLLILGREGRESRWPWFAFLVLLLVTVANYSYQILSADGLLYGVVIAATFLLGGRLRDQVHSFIGPTLIATPILTVAYGASRLLLGFSNSDVWADLKVGAVAAATTLGLWGIGLWICRNRLSFSMRVLFVMLWAIAILWLPMWVWVATLLNQGESVAAKVVGVTLLPTTVLTALGVVIWAFLSRRGFSERQTVVAFSALAPLSYAGGLGPSGTLALFGAVALAYPLTRRSTFVREEGAAISFPLAVILFWVAIATLDAAYRPLGVATEVLIPTFANAFVYTLVVLNVSR